MNMETIFSVDGYDLFDDGFGGIISNTMGVEVNEYYGCGESSVNVIGVEEEY